MEKRKRPQSNFIVQKCLPVIYEIIIAELKQRNLWIWQGGTESNTTIEKFNRQSLKKQNKHKKTTNIQIQLAN